ncbi:MAG: hypothetical protein CBC13_12110 [Planctomycetia bacterium TMED53]|nr:MAG: hypothetical protein CBC13_12110 [Planctomycetia bacterium TMED53]
MKNHILNFSVVAFLCLLGCSDSNSLTVAPDAGVKPPVVVDPCPVPTAAAVTVSINEVMLENVSTLSDSTGQFFPWIEFYNFGTDPVDLANAYFSDSLADNQRWQFPCDSSETVIEPGEFLVLFFGGDGNPDDLHIDFMPEETGDQIYVLNQSSDFFVFNADLIGADESMGRFQDGEEPVWVLTAATPGSANSAPVGAYLFVRGDLNLDQEVNLLDTNLLIGHLNGAPITTQCGDRLDVNDDGFVNLFDVTFMIEALNNSELTIPSPYPNPGIDPTSDSMECEGP